jgi:HAE1 family hydrophobic/amphiphilic exporter-1
MASFFTFTATRPVAVSMVVAATVVFGFVGLGRLPVNLLPDISYPSVTIRTSYPGASPQDVEEQVSEKVQESVAVVSGLRRIHSISRPGVSDVILQFRWGTPMVFAVSDIRERLDRVFLPERAERPLVLRYDPSLDPVLTLGLTGASDLIELRRIAEEEVERELSEIEGVAAVKVRGGNEEEIRVSIDEAALTHYGLDPTMLAQRLERENLNQAAGQVEEGRTEYLVRALGEFRDLEDIADIVLERRNDFSIRLRHVARIARAPQDKEVISRIDGQPCVLIDVYKEAGANIVALCESVRQRIFGTPAQQAFVAAGRHVAPAQPPPDPADREAKKKRQREEFRAALQRAHMTDYLAFAVQPHGVRMEALQDQSRFIESAVDDVLDSALQGGLFAILVIFLFLRRFSATAILAASIPISLIATFAPMFQSGIDLNIMSLGGLALGVGMLVDNSIVVLESIARTREEGLSRVQAGIEGVARVASAVTASTLTTVAVFFPIVFVEGIAGQLFKDQALTVVYALLMSLAVALFVIPMLATRAQPARAEGTAALAPFPQRASGIGMLLWPWQIAVWTLARAATLFARGALRAMLFAGGLLGRAVALVLGPAAAVFDRVYRLLESLYPSVLRRALRARYAVVGVAAALLVAAVLRIPHLGNEMLPPVHQSEVFVDAFLPRDRTVERTDAVLQPIESAIARLPDVAQTFLASGVDKEELNDSDQGEHSARILVRLHPSTDRARQDERVRDQIRTILLREPEIRSFRFTDPGVLSMTAPLTVEILGRDVYELRKMSARVEEVLRGVPGLRDVRSTLQRGNPELVVRLDRDKLAALDIDPAVVTSILRTKVQGEVPTRFPERERKIDIRVRMDPEEIGTVGRLLAVNVNPRGTPPVPLGSVAEIQQREGPSEIRRIGNLRGAEVQAALVGFDMGSTQSRVLDALALLDRPRGIEVRLGGQREEMEESLRSLQLALLLATFLVYIVMASQFESLIQPLVILVSLPLALIGAVFTLDALDVSLSVIVFLGGIVLAGIVVNNAIILIDQINRLRASGVAKLEAIVQGARIRIRPVLMTTLTTVLGLLPLTGWLAGLPLLGGSAEGVELRAPMAITVIAGLSVSTLLTLVVVPVIYSLSDRRP